MFASLGRYKKRALMFAAALAAMLIVGGGGGVAYAVLTTPTAGITERQYFARQDVASTVSAAANTWQDVPGMSRSVTVPSGTARLVDVRFTAESQCTGSAGTWCSVRAVLVNSAGGVTELYPQSGLDFAFDSASSDYWESNAIERSSNYIGAGTYTVKVQAAKVGSSSFRLDETHLAVELIRP